MYPHTERETLQVYLYMLQVLSFVGGHQGSSICTNIGLDTWLQKTKALLCWPPRSPDLKPCHFFLWGYVKDSFYRLFPRICLSCKDKLSLPPQKFFMTCCSWYGQRWIIGLTSAVSQRAET